VPWFQVDDRAAFHRKVVAAGNPAMGLWVRAGSWSAGEVTEGFVPDHMASTMGTPNQAKRLVDAGLWHRDDARGGYQFHQFTEEGRNPTRETVLSRREQAAKKKRGQREREKQNISNPQVDDSRPGGTVEGVPEGVPGGVNDTTPHHTTRKKTSSSSTRRQEPPREDIEHLCTLLADLVEANGARRPNVTDKWRTEARLMLDRDGRDSSQAERLIRWTANDPFWAENVLSMPTFRKQYDRLLMRARREHETERAKRQQAARPRPSTADQRVAEAELLKTNPDPRVLALGGLSLPGLPGPPSGPELTMLPGGAA
jgi:hypothetical protein